MLVPRYLRRGVAAFERGDYLTARDELTIASKLVPERANPYRWLALTAVQLGDCQAARVHAEGFLGRAAPDDPRAPELARLRELCERTGALTVTSTPDHAELRLDGVVVGTTPYVTRALSAGAHTLRADHPGRASATRTVATTARRIGTPPYMAPEQFTGGVITPAVDVFALGVMLFELVTGELPFVGYDDGRCPQLFDAPRRLGGRGSPDLDALIARCLAREPGQRPRAMTEVARALRGEAGTVGDIADERVTEDAGPVLPTARGVVAMTAGPVRRGARWPWIAAAVIAGAALIGVVVAVAIDGGAAKASAKGPATVTEGRGDGDGSSPVSRWRRGWRGSATSTRPARGGWAR